MFSMDACMPARNRLSCSVAKTGWAAQEDIVG